MQLDVHVHRCVHAMRRHPVTNQLICVMGSRCVVAMVTRLMNHQLAADTFGGVGGGSHTVY